MSRFRKVEAGTWGDERFAALSDDGKLLWLYLLTGPEVTSLPGLLMAGRSQLSEALAWTLKRFDKAFLEFSAVDAEGIPMAKADWKSRVVWLPKAWKHNKPSNASVVKGWKGHWAIIPECSLKTEAGNVLRKFVEDLGGSFAALADTVFPQIATPCLTSCSTPSLTRARTAPAPAPVVSEGVAGEDLVPALEATQAHVDAHGTLPTAEFLGPQPLPDDATLTVRRREIAEGLLMSTGERLDLELEWVRFSAHQRKNAIVAASWDEAWRKWVADAIGYARRDRQRAGDRDRGGPPPTSPNNPARQPLKAS